MVREGTDSVTLLTDELSEVIEDLVFSTLALS